MLRPRPQPCDRSDERGISLIEIMIVMGIFALMMGMVIMGFSTSRAAESTRAVQQVSNAIRYGYDKARVEGAYYRLLVDVEQGTFTLQRADDRMYLPATDRNGELVAFDEGKAEDRAERDRRAEEAYNRSLQAKAFGGGGEAAEEMAGFDPYKPPPRKVPRRRPPLFDAFDDDNALSGLKDATKLPPGIKVKSVQTTDDLAPIVEGEASIYFFPRGQTQRAHILIEDEESDDAWTIKVSPLTGRVSIDEGLEELELPRDMTDVEDDLGERIERRTL